MLTNADIADIALTSLTQQRDALNLQIEQVRQTMQGETAPPAKRAYAKKPQHRISAEGRARIAAAQKRRWAEAKKAKAKV